MAVFGCATRRVKQANATRITAANQANGSNEKDKSFEKEFVASFANPDESGVLDVDIKRGNILVTGHRGKNVIVKLSIPNYLPNSKDPGDGLNTVRSNNPDFDIQGKGNRIEIDSNANQYITNLEIKVPWKTNLILDSYRDGVIKVSQVSGHLNLRSQNNNIRMNNVSGSARVWSYNGSLVASFFEVADDKPLYFESYNGSIDIALPVDIKAAIKFRTKQERC